MRASGRDTTRAALAQAVTQVPGMAAAASFTPTRPPPWCQKKILAAAASVTSSLPDPAELRAGGSPGASGRLRVLAWSSTRPRHPQSRSCGFGVGLGFFFPTF